MSDNHKKGYVAIFRSIQDHWLWQDKPFSRGQAWTDILLQANHSEVKVAIGNQIIICGRGESLNSLETWAERWGWDKSKVRRFLNMLESDTMIERKPTHKTTHLKVVNYDTYQTPRHKDETEMTRKRNGDETEVTPNNNTNHEDNENHTNPNRGLEDFSSDKKLDLDFQKTLLQKSEIYQKAQNRHFKDLVPKEQRTFENLFRKLHRRASEDQNPAVFIKATELLTDKVDWGKRYGKEQIDIQKVFVSAINKEFGFKKNGTV